MLSRWESQGVTPRRGKLAVVHVLSLQAAKDAIVAGADGLAHVFADQQPDDEFISLAAQHHVFVIPTLSLLASAAGELNGPSLAHDLRLAPYLTSGAITDLMGKYLRCAGALRNAQDAVRGLSAEGVPILAGTDAHNLGTAHGASLLGELELLANAGLSPAQALASATSVNAAAFQLNDRGRIAPGKRADLLLVSGDPTARISEIRNVVAVWKLGVQMDRESYRTQLDREKEAEQALRHAPAPVGSESGLVSDFEGGVPATTFGLGWRASAGSLLGGHRPEAQIIIVDGGANNSRKAIQITGAITPGVFGWAGAMFFAGTRPMFPVNLSSKQAISFSTRGDGRTYQVMLFTKSKGVVPSVKRFTSGPDWQAITVPLADFGTDGSDLQGLMFAELAVPGNFRFLIDDIRLEAATATVSPADPPKSLLSPDGGIAIPGARAFVQPAATPKSVSPGWQIDTTSYMWLQGIHGSLDALGRNIDFKASPSDLASRADLGFQGVVAAQHGRLTMSSDVLWTPITITHSNSLLNPAPAILAKARYTPVIFTPEFGYRLIDSRRIKIDALTAFAIGTWARTSPLHRRRAAPP